MTRKEAIKVLENRTQYFVSVQDLVALNMAIDALYPVSREQVEKVWKGCSWCNNEGKKARKLGVLSFRRPWFFGCCWRRSSLDKC